MINKIKYVQRDCTNKDKIDKLLNSERTGVIGMSDDHSPYAVPVNFVWSNGCIYLHGLGSGRKEDILKNGPSVCFTVFKEYGTVTDPVPCHSDTSYMSVMIFGKAEKVVDTTEATNVLQKVVEKYMPGFYNKPLSGEFVSKYRSSIDGNAVSVYKITPVDITAKENNADADKIFMKKSSSITTND